MKILVQNDNAKPFALLSIPKRSQPTKLLTPAPTPPSYTMLPYFKMFKFILHVLWSPQCLAHGFACQNKQIQKKSVIVWNTNILSTLGFM